MILIAKKGRGRGKPSGCPPRSRRAKGRVIVLSKPGIVQQRDGERPEREIEVVPRAERRRFADSGSNPPPGLISSRRPFR